MSDKYKIIEVTNEWTANETRHSKGLRKKGCWYARAKWFEDKHFYGYLTNDHVGYNKKNQICFVVVGAYDENLGISLIAIPASGSAMLYRAVFKENGILEGDFYAVKRIEFGEFSLNDLNFSLGDEIEYIHVGRSKMTINVAPKMFDDELKIEQSKILGEQLQRDKFLKSIYLNYSSPLQIFEILQDLERNVYPFETGEEYIAKAKKNPPQKI